MSLIGSIVAGAGDVTATGQNLMKKLGLDFGPGEQWLINEDARKKHFALLSELRQLNTTASGELKEMLKEPLSRGVQATHYGVGNWPAEAAWMQEQHTKIMYYKQVQSAGGSLVNIGGLGAPSGGLLAVGLIVVVGMFLLKK